MDFVILVGTKTDKLVRTVLRKKFLSFATSGRQRSKNIGEKHLFEVRSPQLQGISNPHQANHVFMSYWKTCDISSKAVHDSSDVVELSRYSDKAKCVQ